MNILNDLVSIKDDKAITTSLIIAEAFEKRHDNVIQAISKLECSNDFSLLNFKETSDYDCQNKKRKIYEITRDGFMFLVMGFTGKKAAEWKEKFIIAFNKMEKQLKEKNDDLSPAEYLLKQAEILFKQEKLLKEHDNRLSILEEIQSKKADVIALSPAPKQKTTRASINEIVRSFVERNEDISFQEAWRKLYTEFKYRYSIDLKTRAKNRHISVIEMAEELGYLDELLAVAINIFV